MVCKCCTQHASKFGKLSSGHRTGKGLFIPIPKKGNAKECSNYRTIVLTSHTSKVMLKILPVTDEPQRFGELGFSAVHAIGRDTGQAWQGTQLSCVARRVGRWGWCCRHSQQTWEISCSPVARILCPACTYRCSHAQLFGRRTGWAAIEHFKLQ